MIAMGLDTLLYARQIDFRRGSVTVLQGIDLEVHEGEILGLLGLNGAGKSTIMAILAGCKAPNGGKITIAGFDLLDHPRQSKRLLGYLPERPPLYNDLTVDEYLRFSGRLRGLRHKHLQAVVDDIKLRIGLERAGNALIGTLSKGYRQRVGIAQALIHDPPVLILDEPTSGLDSLQARELRILIRNLREKHAILLATHLLDEAAAVCDRVQILHHGRTMGNERVDRLDGCGGKILIVGFEQLVDEALLKTVHGVAAVECQGQGEYQLHCVSDIDPVAEVAQMACELGWRLRKLHYQRAPLEAIFTRLIHLESSLESSDDLGSRPA